MTKDEIKALAKIQWEVDLLILKIPTGEIKEHLTIINMFIRDLLLNSTQHEQQ